MALFFSQPQSRRTSAPWLRIIGSCTPPTLLRLYHLGADDDLWDLHDDDYDDQEDCDIDDADVDDDDDCENDDYNEDEVYSELTVFHPSIGVRIARCYCLGHLHFSVYQGIIVNITSGRSWQTLPDGVSYGHLSIKIQEEVLKETNIWDFWINPLNF